MKRQLKKHMNIDKDIKMEFFRKCFGFTLFGLLTSGFKLGLIVCIFIGILFTFYIMFMDKIFDLIVKAGIFVYNKYLKDTISGILSAKKKIQGD